MTLKEILQQSLKSIFSDEIDDGYFLFVKRESGNMVIGCSPYGRGKIHVKGMESPLREFSMIDPKSIDGLSIVSEYVTYWIRFINEDGFEILCCSNWVGRSTMNLLEIRRTNGDKWIVENGRGNRLVPEQIVYEGDSAMAQGVFGILAAFGNPYQPYQESMRRKCYRNQPEEYLINVDEGVLQVDGQSWFHFPNF